MKKHIIFTVFIVNLLLFSGCKFDEKNPLDASQTEPEEEVSFTSIYGNYVDGSYAQRNEGYDWVGVRVKNGNEGQIEVQVRSRADKKRPTCTFDVTAYMISDSTYQAMVDGKQVLFNFANQKLTISTEPQDENVLYFYCSGGATLAGTYSKIEEDLDVSQVDKTSFSKVLRLQDVGFNISSIEKGENITLTIMPFGLTEDNREVTHNIYGQVVGAEVEDLNSDGSPEIVVYTQSDGSGSYGDVIGYSVNNKKSMSQIYFPPTAENNNINQGYMGHDEFTLVETYLVQRFPVYNPQDSNAEPTGGIRQISYKLKDGENGRYFDISSVSEFK